MYIHAYEATVLCIADYEWLLEISLATETRIRINSKFCPTSTLVLTHTHTHTQTHKKRRKKKWQGQKIRIRSIMPGPHTHIQPAVNSRESQEKVFDDFLNGPAAHRAGEAFALQALGAAVAAHLVTGATVNDAPSLGSAGTH